MSCQRGWKYDTGVTSQTPSNPAPIWGFAQPGTPLASQGAVVLHSGWLLPSKSHSSPNPMALSFLSASPGKKQAVI